MEVPFKAIQDGLNSIGEFFNDLLSNIGSILEWLNPFSDKFFLKGLLSFLDNALSYINPFDENFFVYKLISLLGDLLNWLFVPSNNPFDSLSNKFDKKFSFVNQIKNLFSGLLGFNNYGDKAPNFTMSWAGVTFAFIDFSMFLDYRLWLHGVILAIAWFVFIRKTFNKLPSIIGGFGQ